MVVIRLARAGTRGRPFYHVVVTDSRNKRDGRYIERVGFFNPIARGGEAELQLDPERIEQWVARGAQLSPRVRQLLRQQRAQGAAAA
jgi:small subunit ribosomal protein S16